MKRIICIAVFGAISAILLTLGILSAKVDSDGMLAEKSEEQISAYDGLWISPDGYIVSLYPYHGKEAFLKNMTVVTDLGKSSDIPVYLAVPPLKMDVLDIPENIDRQPYLNLFSLAESECKNNSVTYIDILTPLRSDDGLYFATDHHWTAKGAYTAYCAIVSAMGETPIAADGFTVETVHTAYRGSDYNKTEKSPDYTVYDKIELYYTDKYPSLCTTLVAPPYDSEENNVTDKEMYFLDKLESWDPYTVYFGGNQPYVTVRSGENRKTLLIVRDSFASALAPLLANHFDIVMIDPRFCPERLSEISAREGASMILVLENMGSFTENTIKFTY